MTCWCSHPEAAHKSSGVCVMCAQPPTGVPVRQEPVHRFQPVSTLPEWRRRAVENAKDLTGWARDAA